MATGKLLYFYGTVNSSKSLNLLSMVYNYDMVGWHTVAIKPAIDTRSIMIETRAHVPPRKCDIILNKEDSIYDYNEIINNADVIFVDECQFLTELQVDELRNIATHNDIDVLCFGLRTDFTGHLFPASKRLFELSDEIKEIKTICSICGKHASFNARVNHDSNDIIDPSWSSFEARCHLHFNNA
jgi:thymidine kinase